MLSLLLGLAGDSRVLNKVQKRNKLQAPIPKGPSEGHESLTSVATVDSHSVKTFCGGEGRPQNSLHISLSFLVDSQPPPPPAGARQITRPRDHS